MIYDFVIVSSKLYMIKIVFIKAAASDELYFCFGCSNSPTFKAASATAGFVLKNATCFLQ
mgnify:CR=1 FL=1